VVATFCPDRRDLAIRTKLAIDIEFLALSLLTCLTFVPRANLTFEAELGTTAWSFDEWLPSKPREVQIRPTFQILNAA
jgi:hypothetical protein